MLYVGLGLLMIIGTILLLVLCAKKFTPNLSRPKKIIAIVLIAAFLFFIGDFILIQNHYDPLFSIPFSIAGDGGSTHFIGLFYHIQKSVAYTLGSDSPPFFNYYIAPWFFGI